MPAPHARTQEEERWIVQLEGQDKTLKLKEANLDPQ